MMTMSSAEITREFVAQNVLESLSRIRSFLRTTCEEALFGEPPSAEFDPQVAELELAATELISNIIRHGFEGLPRTDLKLLCEVNRDGELRLELQHHGRAFQPAQGAVPEVLEPLEGGMGLFLISECVDSVKYSMLADGTNQIILNKNLNLT